MAQKRVSILWVLTILGTLYGGFTFAQTLMLADSAPQQAAGAAMAVGWAILPYILARAVSELLS